MGKRGIPTLRQAFFRFVSFFIFILYEIPRRVSEECEKDGAQKLPAKPSFGENTSKCSNRFPTGDGDRKGPDYELMRDSHM